MLAYTGTYLHTTELDRCLSLRGVVIHLSPRDHCQEEASTGWLDVRQNIAAGANESIVTYAHAVLFAVRTGTGSPGYVPMPTEEVYRNLYLCCLASNATTLSLKALQHETKV